MKMFFYCLREFDELDFAKEYSKKYGIDFDYTTEYPSPSNMELARGCVAVSATPFPITADMLKQWNDMGVKYFTTRSIGFDHVDLAAAKELGMRVSNVSYPPNGVANYAVMMMMMCLRRMPYIMKAADVQDYTLRNKIGTDLSTCTVGVIGTGNIGATVVKRLNGFGCRVLAYDVRRRSDVNAEYVDLPQLFAECDVITLHTPLTPESRHLICAETIAQMKKGVCIVNTARGGLIDTAALLDGLRSGQVGSCALDVMEDEAGLYYANRMYDVIDNPHMAMLRACPNVLLSPHTAFYTREDVSDMVEGNFRSTYNFANGIDDSHAIV